MTEIYLGSDIYEVTFDDNTICKLTKDEIIELSKFDFSDNNTSKEDLIENIQYSFKQVEQYSEGIIAEINNITEQMGILDDILGRRKTNKIKSKIIATRKSIYDSLNNIESINDSYYTEIENLNYVTRISNTKKNN